jgi:hypothetical protein
MERDHNLNNYFAQTTSTCGSRTCTEDLFGEGSYTGKGIYDVDVFEAALHGRVPSSTLLSHDLFEGIFARARLASNVEVVEGRPVSSSRR